MTQRDAYLIASELYKLMRKDMTQTISEVADRTDDELLSHAEAAAFLRTSPAALYKLKGIPYTKNGRKRLYSKLALKKYFNMVADKPPVRRRQYG